jgi:GWxTD domain-containing protein
LRHDPQGGKEDDSMRRTLVPLGLAAWVFASVAGAQLSQTFQDFPQGPAGFLMTASEKKAYAELKNDAEAKSWIDLFWARRDPDLNTVQNEFKLDFEMRVKAADQQFSYGKVSGSMSDRGKVLILMGKPLEAHPAPAGSAEATTGRPDFIERGNSQIWLYCKPGKECKPPVKQDELVPFVFTESRVGSGDYLLDRADRRNIQALKVLAAQPERLLLNPKLTEVPHVGLLPGTKAATAEQQGIFDTQPRPWPQGAAVVTSSGVQSETIHPVWVYVQLPEGAPLATEAIGRVRRAPAGEEAGSFVTPVTALTVRGGRAYEFSLPVDAGDWNVDLALSGASGPVAITTVSAKNEPAPSEGPYISPIIWGSDVRQEPQSHLGAAFHLGGVDLVPHLGNVYQHGDNITYGAYVVRPSLDAQGKPQIELRMALYAGGKKNDEQPFQPVEGVKIVGDVWVFGQILPLDGFRRGTDFEIEVSLRDAKTGLTRSQRIPFTVAKDVATPTEAPKQ